MPRNRAGSRTTAASAVIEIDDVFDARIASGIASASTCLQDPQLELEVFGRRLDDQVRAARASRNRSMPRTRASAAVARVGGDLVLLLQPLEAAADRGDAAVDGRLRDVDHDDIDARNGACLRDAVAHRSGADDADALDRLHRVRR